MNVISKKEIAKGHVYDAAPNAPKRPEGQKTPHWVMSIIPIRCYTDLLQWSWMEHFGKYDAQYHPFPDFLLPILWKILRSERTDQTVGEQTTMLVLQVGLLGAIGGVVAASPAFPVLTNGLLHVGGPALFKVVLAIALLTGASGSGPAGSVRNLTVHV